jgi:alkylation response protein AidB-like acyl-CoA dehydrogenase
VTVVTAVRRRFDDDAARSGDEIAPGVGGRMDPDDGELLDCARALAPWFAAHAPTFEHARRLSPIAVDKLRELGVFRLFVPRAYGGIELDLLRALCLFEELAAADASVGFNAVTWSHAILHAAQLPRATLNTIYAGGPDVIWSNSVVLAGRARAVPGGYLITGRWPLVSGCEAAEWLFGYCEVDGGAAGIAAVAPASAWRLEDDWRALGLCATGSLTVAAEDMFVPAAHVFDLRSEAPQLPGPRYMAASTVLPLHFAAVAIGVARGALSDVQSLMRSGHRRMSNEADLGLSPGDLASLGGAATTLRAARALLVDQATELWSRAEAGTLTLNDWAGDTAAWIARTCAHVVDDCFNLAGTAAISQASPLQRRLRDMHTLAQHRAMNTDHLARGGARSLGQPLERLSRF